MEIPKLSDMEKLWEALREKGISEQKLEKIWSQNVRRVLKEL